jgi:hypothetical protein
VFIRERLSDYDENFLVDFNLRNLVNHVLSRLNSFLEYISENHPDTFLPYVRALGKRLADIITQETELPEAVISLLKNYRLMQTDGSLALVDFFVILRNKMTEVTKITVGLKKYYLQRRGLKMKISLFDRTSGWIIPAYLMAVTLKDILPKEEALEFYNKYIDYTYETDVKLTSTMSMIEEMLSLYESEYSKSRIFTSFKIDEGRIGVKIEKCMIHEALKFFDLKYDKDFGYLVECYPEFHTVKRMNENFVLTRKRSLIKGNLFCDYCWHDTRINQQTNHPEKDLWDRIERITRD